MKKLIASFADKKFRYGAFSTVTIIIVAAVLYAFNMVVRQFDIKFDLSVNKQYSISDETRDIINSVDEDVTIYALFVTGQENLQYTAMLDEYDRADRIKVVYTDPYLNPQFVEKYKTDGEDIPNGSLIAESSKRFKVIREDELYTTEIDYNTFSSYVTSIDFEPQITNAVKYVSEDNTPVIYQVTNHDELAIGGNLLKRLTLANYDVKHLDIFTEDAVPSDAAAVIISSPKRDYSPDEAKKITDYLEGGGRAVIAAGYMKDPQPNFYSVMEAYGVTLGQNLVLDANGSNSMSGYPYYLLPNFAEHDINKDLASNTYVMLAYAASLERTEAVRNYTSIESVLTTSRNSYAKKGENISLNKEPSDAEGPFEVAVAITDAVYRPEEVVTKLVIAGTSALIDESINTAVSGANGDFLLGAVNWLSERDDTVYIRPKTGSNMEDLLMDNANRSMLFIFSMVALPGGIIAAGIVVWLKRRNR